MLYKAEIKFVHQLSLSKYRRQYNCFITEGDKCVDEIINSKINIKNIYATRDWEAENDGKEALKNIDVKVVSEQELKKLSQLKTPHNVLAIAEIPAHTFSPADVSTGYALALDQLQDPGNMGTIIRIADWFGIKYILCSEDCVDAYNPKVVQASMGSIARVNITYGNLPDRLLSLNNVPVYGAYLDGENIFNISFKGNGVVIIGNEARGISPELGKLITMKISIPSHGQAESLNAAVATGIICAVIRK